MEEHIYKSFCQKKKIKPEPDQASRSGFLNLAQLTFLDQIIFVVKGCPVHCRMFG